MIISPLKQAVRSLSKSPGFLAVAVLTLALGMGANTTFFSVLYGVVLRSLPYPDAHELMEIRNGGAAASNDGRISLAELRDYRERQRSFAGFGAYVIGRATLNLDDGAERVVRTRITANLMPLLGVKPAIGRGFNESEERAGNDLVVVLSHAFWQTHLRGAPDIVGQTVRLDGKSHIVVGIMPAGFSFADPNTAIWQPVDSASRGNQDRANRSLSVVGRRSSGVSPAQAAADLQRVARQLRMENAASYPGESRWKLGLVPLRDAQFGRMFAPLAALTAAAAAVLLIAGVNVAIMFLLRAAVRRREIAIRLSLGAGRRHIVQQLLAESIVVCALGCAGGALVAVFGLQLLKAFPPVEIPRLQEVAINGPIAAFMIGVLLFVTIFVGLAPAFAVLKNRVVEGMTQSTRVTESRSAVRLRDALTVVEIALAVMLLVCGGLAVRSLRGLLRDDVGFTTQQLLTFKTNLTEDRYPDRARANRFYEQLTAKLEALPGVASVAAVSYLPLSGESQFRGALPVAPNSAPGNPQPLPVAWRVVRGPYFSAMGSTLRAGRLFNETDRAEAPLVTVIDDELARRVWASEGAAIGQRLRYTDGTNSEIRTVVGVIHHLKHAGPGSVSLPEAYVPHEQYYQRGMYTVVKTTGAASGVTPLIRARLAEVDPAIPMYFVETMERRYATALAFPRFTAGLVTAFSTLALLLAGVGIFGVTAYSVAQRQREFGIRFALGSPRAHVARLVLGRVARLGLIGGVIGALGALWAGEMMRSLLVGIEPADLPSLAIAVAAIGLTALAASLAPVIRAMRVDPMEVLRAE
jgi:putative ABC transport system permease protein